STTSPSPRRPGSSASARPRTSLPRARMSTRPPTPAASYRSRRTCGAPAGRSRPSTQWSSWTRLFEASEPRRCSAQLGDEAVDPPGDLVADGADALDRQTVGIRQPPVLVPLADHDRTGAVAGGDDDVGPVDVRLLELVCAVVGGVDADLSQ